MNIGLELELIKRNLLGMPVHDLKRQQFFAIINEAIATSHKLVVFGICSGTYGELNKHPEYVYFFNQMDIVLPEGGGIPLLGYFFNVPISEHLAITDISNELLKIASENGYKIQLFGATQEVNDKAIENIRKEYPFLKIAKGINGYFKHEDELHIVDEINLERPDILFIGITSPIKEKFALKYKSQLKVKIIIPCGGYIDVLAGVVSRPTYSFKWFPTTWFYRFIKEPRRLYRQTLFPIFKLVFFIFPLFVLKHKLGIESNPSIIKFYNLENYIYSFENE
jgi:N-acetylglucosaminyldiphosphoundecaprenol N-acetyl-beta-D-mannosaminyltransferase